MNPSTTLALVVSVLTVTAGVAAASDDPFAYRTVPDFIPVSEYTRAAIESDGTLHLLTVDIEAGPTPYYLHFEERDGQWTQNVVHEAYVSYSFTSQLAVDADGGLHAAYGGVTEVIYMHRPPGGSWSTTLIPEPEGAVCVDLVVDASGDPHLVWERYETTGETAVATRTDGGPFTIIRELTGFQEPAIDLTPHGSALVSAWDGDGLTFWIESDDRVTRMPADPGFMARGITPELDLAHHDGVLNTVTSQGFCIQLDRIDLSGGGSRDTLACALAWLDDDVQIAAGPDGTLHATGSSGLYARRDPDGVVSSRAFPGVNTVNLALDAEGLPVLVYRFDGQIWIADSRLSVSGPTGDRVIASASGVVTWQGGGEVDVDLSPDGGASWIPLGRSVTGQLDVIWPDLVTDDARVRLRREGALPTEAVGDPFTIAPERTLAWTVETPLATSFARASITATEAGQTVILAGATSDLRVLTRDRAGWRTEILDTGEITPSDLVRGADHTLHALYIDEETALRHASFDGESWSVEELASGLYYRPELGMDASGVLHGITHFDDDTEHVHVFNDGGGWTITPLGLEQSGTRESGLAVAADGSAIAAVHLSFADELVTTRWNGTSWGATDLVDIGQVARIEVAYDPTGSPVIAYAEQTSNEIRIARWNDDGYWDQGEVVLNVGANTTQPLSFRIARDGTEYLAFQLPIPDDLAIYRNRGDGWELVHEHAGSELMGLVPSLAIDAQDNLRVVHFDNTRDLLHYRYTAIELGSPVASSSEAWPVGGVRTLEVHGSGRVDLSLSVDGGATWDPLASNVPPGPVEIAVPNRPTRYARIQARRLDPAPGSGGPLLTESVARTDGFFTIESDITASFFRAALDGRTARLSWETEPGLDDLRGYHVERHRGAGWSMVTPTALRATELAVEDARPGERFRLVAIDGLGSERRIAETVIPARSALAARPQPYRAGTMTVHFTVAASLDGGETDTRVELFDLTGRRVRSLVAGPMPPGPATVTWDGIDARGHRAAAGVYFLRLRSGVDSRTVKVHVVR